MRKFTQGTWKSSVYPIAGKNANSYLIQADDDYVAFVNKKADMRLIILAPQMYAIVEQVASLTENQPVTEQMIGEAKCLLLCINGFD